MKIPFIDVVCIPNGFHGIAHMFSYEINIIFTLWLTNIQVRSWQYFPILHNIFRFQYWCQICSLQCCIFCNPASPLFLLVAAWLYTLYIWDHIPLSWYGRDTPQYIANMYTYIIYLAMATRQPKSSLHKVGLCWLQFSKMSETTAIWYVGAMRILCPLIQKLLRCMRRIQKCCTCFDALTQKRC